MTKTAEQIAADKVAQVAAETARQVAEKAQESTMLIRNDISYIKTDIADIKIQLGSKYVTQDQFDPIKRIVYGAVGTILVSFLLAIIGLVIILQRR